MYVCSMRIWQVALKSCFDQKLLYEESEWTLIKQARASVLDEK